MPEAVKEAIGTVEAPKRTSERAKAKEMVEPELPNDAKLCLIEHLVFSPGVPSHIRQALCAQQRPRFG